MNLNKRKSKATATDSVLPIKHESLKDFEAVLADVGIALVALNNVIAIH